MMPVHIRHSVWKGQTPTEVLTFCGETDGGSISFRHAREAYDGSITSAVTKNVASLEICDNCNEEFKRTYDPQSYSED